jgi:hypothetical protein
MPRGIKKYHSPLEDGINTRFQINPKIRVRRQYIDKDGTYYFAKIINGELFMGFELTRSGELQDVYALEGRTITAMHIVTNRLIVFKVTEVLTYYNNKRGNLKIQGIQDLGVYSNPEHFLKQRKSLYKFTTRLY